MKSVPITVKEWKGLNTADERSTFEDGQLAQAKNIDLPDSKTIRKRNGLDKNAATLPTGSASDRIHLLGRHHISGGDKLYYQTVNGAGAGLKVLKCDIGTHLNNAEITIGGAAITGPVYAYQYNDLMYLVRQSGTMLSVTLAGTAATSITSSPSGSQVIAHKGRLWVADFYGGGGSITRLYYSTASLTWGTGDAGNIDINFGDGVPIVGLVVLSDLLLVFKQNSVWSVNADSADTGDWIVRKTESSIGCVARDSIQVIDNEVFFLSNRGFYKTDGITFTLLSASLDDSTLSSFISTGSNQLFLHSAYFHNRYIVGSLWFGGAANHLVYHIRRGEWTLWNFAKDVAGMVTVEERGVLAGTEPGVLMGSFEQTGLIWRYRDIANYQDDGENFTVTIETGDQVYDTPANFKRCVETDLDVDNADTTGGTLSLFHTIDRNTALATQNRSTFAERSIQRYQGPGYARHFRSTITFAGDFPFELFSMTHWMMPKDRVPNAH